MIHHVRMGLPVQITHPDFQSEHDKALSPHWQDFQVHTDLDLVDALKGMLTEIASEGYLTGHCLMHNLAFLIGILSFD